ncbi:uncharacterized protein LOC129924531 [Biomphalaria glabrata]|uniref:Uncharacterized protein LOC129924531 n=1 Tax=Biomphalaria glabrata TaxID=6526 RepID=A0A9W2ZL91_BIOGL|nr:uncharacterized protein LOC129924531 [Biomphalaria glabrata]XP_055875703.1 uncharacterized protein LOC129924531 [Biomphalaria glabrata]XP_055875704.1 uncharacterized protein LOC129924531 [Biomphalaria glabrata]XP_055875705.1 uncharacterized protein LOC129924531 [Biomphalaria glabrata]XP_055875706.1 uncharacterized protein LOC129924531 [Biomphalaria glabrata]
MYLFDVEPDMEELLSSMLGNINSKIDAMNTKIAAMNQRIPDVEERIVNTDVRSDAKTSERSVGGDHENPLKPDEAVERHMQVEIYQPDLHPTDVGPAANTEEGSPDGGQENPRKPDVEVDGHLHDESHRQGLKPTDDWPYTETREGGPDGGEESRMEPDAEDEGPLHEECYQPAPRACPPDKAEDDDLYHNSPPCGFEAHPSPSSQSPMKPPLLPTILVSPALTSYTSPCVKWLSSVPTDKRAMQPQRHCNKRTINWRKRRRRRLRSPMCMVILPRNNCSHMKTNWRRRRRLLLLSAIWMTMRSRGRYNQMKANWRRRRKRILSSTWMAMKARRRGNQVKANWRRRRKRPLLTATWMAPLSSRRKPTATDRPPPTAMKFHSQCHEVESARDGHI